MTRPGDNRRIGLRDIAEILGISSMTVSRAIRGTSYVEASLKKRILEEARRLGYTSNPLISEIMGALRQSQKPRYRETIAILTASDPSPYYEAVVSGIESVAEQLDYRVDKIGPASSRSRGKTTTRMLRARGIRGVIIAPPLALITHPHFTLEWNYFSTVLIGSSLANHGLPRVQADHYSGCKFLLRKLQHAGYRRIGLVLSKAFHERTNRQIQAAFHSWHPKREAAEALTYYFESEPDPQTYRRWIESSRPDCLVSHTDWLRLFAQDARYAVPPNCGLASLTVGADRHFTGIQTDRMFFETGTEAMRCLDSQLRNGLSGLQPRPLTVMIPPDWQTGKTATRCTPAPKPATIVKAKARRRPNKSETPAC